MAQRVRKIKHIKRNSSTHSIIYSSNDTSIKHLLGSVLTVPKQLISKTHLYTHNPNANACMYMPL